MPINLKTLALVATPLVGGAILYKVARLVEVLFEGLEATDYPTS